MRLLRVAESPHPISDHSNGADQILRGAVLLPPAGAPLPQAAVACDRLAHWLVPRLLPQSRLPHEASSDGECGILVVRTIDLVISRTD